MRKLILLCGAVLFLAAQPPVLLRAQFRQPTADELKMTADPMAPGADAVYLNIEEVANDPMHYKSTYKRIKVLTEKGKELATVELPYLRGTFKVSGIKGRTIHPDGTIIPLTVKPEDLTVSKTSDQQIARKVFSLPDVTVGSILEYSYEIRYDDNLFSSPLWQLQGKYFVHQAHYSFTPFKAFMPNGTPGTDTSMYLTDSRGRAANALIWWSRLPQGVTINTSVNGSYSVDVNNIPPSPDEEWMPPIESLLYRVNFYYSYARDAAAFWQGEVKLWSKDVDKFAEPSKDIANTVSGLIAPTDSDLDKAKKLYDAVQALDNTDFSRVKTASEMKELKIKAAKRAEDTWSQKGGSGDDIAMLYLAMLRAAGLTAYAVRVVDRDRNIFDPAYMSLDQLDSTLVDLSTGGKEILLDPGEKMCPFGVVNWRHSHAEGLRQSADGPGRAITPTQVFGSNTIKRGGEMTVDPHGGITGTLQIVMTGQEALRWRQTALEVDASELKKAFDRDLEKIVPEGVEAHVDHFLGLDDPGSLLMAIVKVTGTLGTATSKRLILPGFFFETRESEPFVNEETRQQPIDMHYAEQVTEQLIYDLPAGASVEGAPEDTKVSWEGRAVYIVKSKSDPGQITVARVLARAFDLARPLDYQDLRGFYQKVSAADQGQLVFTVPANQKGF